MKGIHPGRLVVIGRELRHKIFFKNLIILFYD